MFFFTKEILKSNPRNTSLGSKFIIRPIIAFILFKDDIEENPKLIDAQRIKTCFKTVRKTIQPNYLRMLGCRAADMGETHSIKGLDSLVSEYFTQNKRVVKDGAGITPDIKVADKEYSDLLATLMQENIVFDFATNYYFKHESIASPEEFALTEADYETFVAFALNHEFEYETSSANMLKELKSVVVEDEFWDEVEGEYAALEAKLQRDKKGDMTKFKPEIKLMLENEIIGRYYYSKGRIRAYLPHDEEVLKAIEVLNNKTYYDSVLDGTCADCLVKKG